MSKLNGMKSSAPNAACPAGCRDDDAPACAAMVDVLFMVKVAGGSNG